SSMAFARIMRPRSALLLILLTTLATSACHRHRANPGAEPSDPGAQDQVSSPVVSSAPVAPALQGAEGVSADYAVVQACWREGRETTPVLKERGEKQVSSWKAAAEQGSIEAMVLY